MLVEDALDHCTSDLSVLVVRDCYRLLPVDKRLTWLCLLPHVALAVSAVASIVTILLAVEALLVLVLRCQFRGVISRLLSFHELAFTFALDVPAIRTLAFHCTDLHGRYTAYSLSGSVLHLLSDHGTSPACWRAQSTGAATNRPACAASQARTSPRPECRSLCNCCLS